MKINFRKTMKSKRFLEWFKEKYKKDPHHIYSRRLDFCCVPVIGREHEMIHSKGMKYAEAYYNKDYKEELIHVLLDFIQENCLEWKNYLI